MTHTYLGQNAADLGMTGRLVPWLDPTPLAFHDLPRPWSEEDYERDRRRYNVAFPDAGELTRDVWIAYAEKGTDAVAEIVRERDAAERADAARVAAMEKDIADRREDDERAARRNAEARIAERREAELREEIERNQRHPFLR